MNNKEETKELNHSYGFKVENKASSLTQGGSGNWVEGFNNYYTPDWP